MSDSEASPDPAMAGSTPSPTTGDTAAGRAPNGHRRLWASAVIAGLLGGLSAWAGGEAIVGRFDPAISFDGIPTAEQVAEADRASDVGKTKTAAVASAIFGGAMGLMLGLAGGAAGRSGGRAAIAAGVGAVLGAAGGGGVAMVLMPVFHERYDSETESLVVPLLVHAGLWIVVGIAAGLAFGLGLGGRNRAVKAAIGGLLGAAVGAAAYEVAGGLLFPLDRTYEPVSMTWGSRLFARLCVALLIAAGVVLAITSPTSRKKPAGPTAG